MNYETSNDSQNGFTRKEKMDVVLSCIHGKDGHLKVSLKDKIQRIRRVCKNIANHRKLLSGKLDLAENTERKALLDSI